MPRPSAFSLYASNFLNRSVAPASSQSSLPLFFSVTDGSHLGEEEEDEEGEHVENLQGSRRMPGAHSEIDDDGLPRLVGSHPDMEGTSTIENFDTNHRSVAGPSRSTHPPADDPFINDTYFDDDEDPGIHGGLLADSIPLIASDIMESKPAPRSSGAPGWLAHISRFHSPMPPASEASSEISSPRTSSSEPPDYLLGRGPTPPPTRTTLSESLLPRDGITRSIFSLPEPGRIPKRKYNDSIWTSIWCFALLICGIGSIIVLFVTAVPKPSKSPEKKPPSPYMTITHAIPLLTFLTILSSAVSYVHLILLRFAVRPVLIATALAVPVALVIGSLWAFAASFYWEEGVESTWGETVGLRLFALIPLALAGLSARSLYHRQKSLLRTVAVVELSTLVVLEHQHVLVLSLGLLLVSLIASLPFLSLIIRLTLIGYYSKETGHTGWHIRGYAGWLAFLATCVWIWSWGVVRGLLKVSVAGVVGSWYFARREAHSARPNSLVVTQSAFARASGASLGSICVATLVLALTQTTTYILRSLRRMSTPPQLSFLAFLHPLELITGVISIFDSLSSYALMYVGITGDPFLSSARRAREIMNSGGRGGRSKGTKSGDYALLSFILTLSSLSISLLAAVGGYIFAARSLSSPDNAPLVSLLTGAVTFLTMQFGVGVSEDAADTLYLCYRIDLDAGATTNNEVFEAFEGKRQPPLGEP